MHFLDEKRALITIREMLAATSEAKLAVAFWGTGALKKLGLNRPKLDLTIICNLDSGACNPAEIRQIISAGMEERVFSDPRLHAKVYWTPSRAVIGSSNASANGLAVDGSKLEGWAEANILVEDRSVLREIREWFDVRLANAYLIENHHLERAEDLWLSRVRAAAPGVELSGDLLSAYRKAPEHPSWRLVRFALWTEHADKAADREATAQIKEQPALSSYEYYQGWNDKLRGGEWLIDFDLSSRKASFSGFYQVPDPKIESDTISFVRGTSHIKLPGFGALALTEKDKELIQSLAPTLLDQFGSMRDRNALIDITKVIEKMDSRALLSDIPNLNAPAFEELLRNTYKEASKFGYRPTRFLEMIGKYGAVATAKQLLRPAPPSDGLTTLILNQRTDLSVEHIALQDEWRHLFTPEELHEARQRLGL